MPCRDYEEDWGDPGGRQKKLDEVTAMLCRVCQFLEKEGHNTIIPEPWWTNHKKQDAARLVNEMRARKLEAEAKERDIARLTKELAKLKKTF